jgi:hypothetical protein
MTLEERKAAAKSMYSTEQTCGGLAFVAGVVFLMAHRFGAPPFAFPLGWAAITLGWALVGYAFARRALFVRSDNTDPKA